MHSEQLRELVYGVVSGFFQEASVIWAEQVNTEPKVPYVTLKLGNVNRNRFPLADEENENFFHCQVTLEVNLFTKGKPVSTGANVTINYANTATADLMNFCNYVDSDEITDMITNRGVDFELMPPVRDLSMLENDRKYRYRAMAEFTVSYAEEAGGLYGLSGTTLPNNSGGGTSDMNATDIYVVEDVEISEDDE